MRAIVVPLLAVAAVLPAGRASAQEPEPAPTPVNRQCTLRVDPGGITSSEGDLVNIHDPFTVVCNDGANIRANSGVFDRVARVVTLTGDVFFDDPTRSLTSDRAVYDSPLGMLHATGNVVFTDRVEGTTLSGPELEYYRANENRPLALVNAMGRPRLTLTRRPGADTAATPDSPGAQDDAQPQPGAPPIIGQPVTGAEPAPADTSGMPLTIDADRMTIEGRNDLTAFGNVVIQDDQMRALATEAEQRGSAETLELRGNAEIHSREYSLAADVIFATVPGGSIQDVEARGNARLLGEELNVDAPRLDLFFENDLLQRSIARSDSALAPGVRPVTTSPTFRLQADSIDASLPGQRLETVVAVGNARGETIDTTSTAPASTDTTGLAAVDSLGAALENAEEAPRGAQEVAPRYESGDSVTTMSAAQLVANDWITGDTITGYFASVVAQPEDSVAAEADAEAEAEPEPDPAAGEVPPIDPGDQPGDTTIVMQRLVSVGAARSLYHVAPEEGSPPGTRAGINFLSAAHIELTFENGQVQEANVTGLRRGLYLEPVTAADTTAAGEDGAEGAQEGEPPATEDAVPEAGPEQPPAQPATVPEGADPEAARPENRGADR